MYRAFHTYSDLLFVAQLHNVGGNTAGNIDVRLSNCLIHVRYNSTVQQGDCVICWLEIGKNIWKVPFYLASDVVFLVYAEHATLNMKTKM